MPYRKKRVLFVDDDRAFTALIKTNLEQDGRFHVWTENKSTRGVMAAKMFKPDVILLDVNMPHPDGSELAQALRHLGPLKHVPIIFFTGLADPHHTGAGNDEQLLSKTTALPALQQCLEDAIAGAEVTRWQTQASGEAREFYPRALSPAVEAA